jgi:hypothetical protein
VNNEVYKRRRTEEEFVCSLGKDFGIGCCCPFPGILLQIFKEGAIHVSGQMTVWYLLNTIV